MNKDFEASIVLAGVGGQGTLIAGKLLGILSVKMGLDVKVSEVHGMSQRGGAVITYVKIGKKVNSPIIEQGCADFLLSFEEIESVRWASLLKKNGVMIINTQKIKSLPVLLGQTEYPQNSYDALKEGSIDSTKVIEIDALKLALESGTSKAVNMVMLGSLSKFMGVEEAMWLESINEAFASKPKVIPTNIDAFEKGRDAISK